jgi:hypothetical protein
VAITNWLTDSPICEWTSIGCNDQGAITSLNLTNLYLRGYLPLQISLLSNLKVLDLSSNSKSGSYPTEITTLSNLQSLKLDGKQLPPPAAHKWKLQLFNAVTFSSMVQLSEVN